tara:strand:+ start:667 stop:837 length:171 start_codon:yes stop_codon:yes gene_type:complete
MTRHQKRMRRRAMLDVIFIATVLAGAALLAVTVRGALEQREFIKISMVLENEGERR